MKSLVAILFVLLFSTGYWWCFLLVGDYTTHEQQWWDWRMGLLSVLIFGLFVRVYQLTNHLEKLIYSIGMALSAADVIDRVVFGITDFTASDLILIPLTLAVAFYVHFRKKNTNDIIIKSYVRKT